MKRLLQKRFLWTLTTLAVVVTLALPIAALASSVDVAVVDVTAPTGGVTLAAGASGPITINLTVTGNQAGTATFKVYRDWLLSGGTFAGSNPQQFTVPPRAAQDPATTFSTSGTVSVATGHAAGGPYTLAVSAFEITNSNQTGAKLSVGTSSSYQVTVSAPADTTPPVITPSVVGTLGNNGWYVSDVTVSWTVSDPESAYTIDEGCVTTTIDYDTAGALLKCKATSAGGTSSQSVTIKRDATAPTIIWSEGINDGDIFYWGFVPSAPTCTASDSLSGPNGCTVSGYSAEIGTHTLTATAYDVAGNMAKETRTYEVKAWTLTGFYQPVDMSNNGLVVWNTVKGGSTVPLKFEVFAGSTELMDVSVVKSFTATPVACPVSGYVADEIEFVTTGGTVLRYDLTAGQFIQNWQTPKKPGSCIVVTMTTQDGSSLSANFKLK